MQVWVREVSAFLVGEMLFKFIIFKKLEERKMGHIGREGRNLKLERNSVI